MFLEDREKIGASLHTPANASQHVIQSKRLNSLYWHVGALRVCCRSIWNLCGPASYPAKPAPLDLKQLEKKMTFKLCLRLALLTGLLMILLSTFKTQQTAACSPGWYDGCVSRCDSQYDSCL